MRNYISQLLNSQFLDDSITCFNLVYPGKTLRVSKKWYLKAMEHGYLDDCCFNIVVSNKMFNPLTPELL